MGYKLDEVVGRHHSMFVEPAYRDSADYEAFWSRLRRKEFIRESSGASAGTAGSCGSRGPTAR